MKNPVRRILMTADTVGGVFSYSLELAAGLSEAGIQVYLACMGRKLSPDQWEAAGRVPGLEIFESEYRLEWMEDPWDDVDRSGSWLLSLEASLKPDLIHLNTFSHGALPWRKPVLLVAHSCVVSWFQAVKGEDPPASWDEYRRRVTAGLAGADWVAAPTASMLRSLQRNYGGLSRTSVLFNGRRPENFPAGEKGQFFFAAGRLWDEGKNIAVLDRIAAELPWPVYAAGDRGSPPGSGSPAGGISFLGTLSGEDIAAWFGRAPVFVHPARYEPFGLAPLEAALSGAALVLGDIPSLREVWGDAAVFVPPDDEAELETVLRELSANPAFREQLAAKSGERAHIYDSRVMVRSYLELYRRLGENKSVHHHGGNTL